jgi:Domain of unknown function (DUF4404)
VTAQDPVPLSTAAVQDQLRAVAKILHEAGRLNPKAKELLAELVEELGRSLDAGAVPTQDLAHLTECAGQLVQVAKQTEETGALRAARNRLDNAIIRIDAEFPTIAGIARRLTETLADLGI